MPDAEGGRAEGGSTNRSEGRAGAGALVGGDSYAPVTSAYKAGRKTADAPSAAAGPKEVSVEEKKGFMREQSRRRCVLGEQTGVAEEGS